jgi:hypothetical protein
VSSRRRWLQDQAVDRRENKKFSNETRHSAGIEASWISSRYHAVDLRMRVVSIIGSLTESRNRTMTSITRARLDAGVIQHNYYKLASSVTKQYFSRVKHMDRFRK